MAKIKHGFGEINESNVDAYIKTLMEGQKGTSIIMSIGFSKKDPREIALLRASLLASYNFSALTKDALKMTLAGNTNIPVVTRKHTTPPLQQSKELMPNKKNMSGFM